MVIIFKLLFIYILTSNIYAFESYSIYFFGIPIIDVNMENNRNELVFKTQSRGLFNSIWSINNNYYTTYDSISFGVRNYSKSITQGSYTGELNCKYIHDNMVLRCGEVEVSVNNSEQNIFTLLAQLSYKSADYLDSKWFEMNHEGLDYNARFLLIGNDEIIVNNTKVLCDHFKLDIIKINSKSNQLSPWDYFTDNIASEDALRQLWVSNASGKRRIVKASVSLYGMVMTAEINNY